jgi:hypothetical protein
METICRGSKRIKINKMNWEPTFLGVFVYIITISEINAVLQGLSNSSNSNLYNN